MSLPHFKDCVDFHVMPLCQIDFYRLHLNEKVKLIVRMCGKKGLERDDVFLKFTNSKTKMIMLFKN